MKPDIASVVSNHADNGSFFVSKKKSLQKRQ